MERQLPEKTHYYYIDYLRVIAALFVVYMHTASSSLWVDDYVATRGWNVLSALTSLAFCAVPLFFMISGFLLLRSASAANITVLFKKRLPRLVVPLIFWSVIAVAWMCYSNALPFTEFISRLFGGVSDAVMIHLWFMYTLIALYLVSPLLYGAVNGLSESGRKYVVVFIFVYYLLAAAGAFLPDAVKQYFPNKIISNFFAFEGHVFAFLLGAILGKTDRKVPNSLLIAVAVCDLTVIIVGTYLRSRSAGSYDSLFQTQNSFFEVLLAVCIFLLFKQNFNRAGNRLFSYIRSIAPLTFTIYLSHAVFLSVSYRLQIPSGGVIPCLAVTAALFFFCIFCARILSSVKLLSFPATGQNFESARSYYNYYKKIKKRTP